MRWLDAYRREALDDLVDRVAERSFTLVVQRLHSERGPEEGHPQLLHHEPSHVAALSHAAEDERLLFVAALGHKAQFVERRLGETALGHWAFGRWWQQYLDLGRAGRRRGIRCQFVPLRRRVLEDLLLHGDFATQLCVHGLLRRQLKTRALELLFDEAVVDAHVLELFPKEPSLCGGVLLRWVEEAALAVQ